VVYVCEYLKSRWGNFWACLTKGCAENWREATRIETLAFQRAKNEEQARVDQKRLTETEEAERVRRERELSAEADRVISTLSAKQLEALTKEAVEALKPEEK
jgi:hypothetical protein